MSFKFHHILYCSNVALIESFFKEVLLFEQESFKHSDISGESFSQYLTYQNARVFFSPDQSFRERTPFVIEFEQDQWEEVQQRIEFWQYRHRPSLEEFELSFQENLGSLSDENGQKIVLLKNCADSFLPSINTVQASF